MKELGNAANKAVIMAACLVTVACLANGVAAQVGCMSTFFGAIVQLSPCRPAVVPFIPEPPSEACCGAVRALGQPCLCALLSGPPITGVNRDMAMQLPAKCAINFEPCNGGV